MIDTLLAFGCSHTYGDEAIADYNIGIDKQQNIYAAFPFFLSQHLKCRNYHNYSISGSSNQEIASIIFDKLNFHKKEINENRVFIVIGWTSNNRLKVSQSNPRSYFSLINTLNHIPLISRLKYYAKKTEELNPLCESNSITITHGIVKLIYNILFNVSIKKTTEPYRAFNRNFFKNKIEDKFSNDFIIGIEKHIFNTSGNNDTNFFIKLCVDQYLTRYNIPYVALPTIKNDVNVHQHLLNQKNNISPFDYNFETNCFIKHFGNKYGHSSSGTHMKLPAHKKLAEFIFDIINTRCIINDYI